MNKIQIGIVDDHQVVINGLTDMLSAFEHLTVSVMATSGKELIESLEKSQPDILIMDIQMPQMDGIALGKQIKKLYPKVKIIAFSSFDDSHYIKQIMRSAASGYLLKNAEKETLIEAIDTVMKGGEYLDEHIRKILLQESITGQKRSMFEVPLTVREIEIIKLIIDGDTNQQIAEKLFISHRTVEKHRLNINQKLDVNNTAGLIREAFKRGLID
jgi:DNA-binding NarL/FixJ family response regulator